MTSLAFIFGVLQWQPARVPVPVVSMRWVLAYGRDDFGHYSGYLLRAAVLCVVRRRFPLKPRPE